MADPAPSLVSVNRAVRRGFFAGIAVVGALVVSASIYWSLGDRPLVSVPNVAAAAMAALLIAFAVLVTCVCLIGETEEKTPQ